MTNVDQKEDNPMMITPDIPCIVCGTELNRVFHDNIAQPDDGLNFEARGHFGSTTFDPIDETYLTINVCDPCVKKSAEAGRIYYQPMDAALQPLSSDYWDCEDDDDDC